VGEHEPIARWPGRAMKEPPDGGLPGRDGLEGLDDGVIRIHC
jgi:hypothetical protein